jgi:hypothetical protein
MTYSKKVKLSFVYIFNVTLIIFFLTLFGLLIHVAAIGLFVAVPSVLGYLLVRGKKTNGSLDQRMNFLQTLRGKEVC